MIDKEQFRLLIAQRLNVSPNEVRDDADLIVDLGGDSLSLAELTAELEREHGIGLSGDALYNLETVGDLWNAVNATANRDLA